MIAVDARQSMGGLIAGFLVALAVLALAAYSPGLGCRWLR